MAGWSVDNHKAEESRRKECKGPLPVLGGGRVGVEANDLK